MKNKENLENCDTLTNDFWHNYVLRERPHLKYLFPYSIVLVPFYEVSEFKEI